MFQRVNRREGFHSVYGAVHQQDIDTFVDFIGKANTFPPAYSATPMYNASGMPAALQPQQTAQSVPPSETQNQTELEQTADEEEVLCRSRSNIVPFKRRGKGGASVTPADKAPGSLEGRFLDINTNDTRPVLLFDLNGTLTSHTAAKRSSGRSLMRPGIHHLRRLQVISILSHTSLVPCSLVARWTRCVVALLAPLVLHAFKGHSGSKDKAIIVCAHDLAACLYKLSPIWQKSRTHCV